MTVEKTNPIENAIGPRAKESQAEPIPLSNSHPSEVSDEPTPTEMVDLEELNRQTEERLREPDEEQPQQPTTGTIPQETITVPQESTTILASKPDPPPGTKTCSQESPPQGIKEFDEAVDASSKKAFEITKNVKKSNAQTLREVRSGVPMRNKEEFYPVGKLDLPEGTKISDFKLKHTYSTGVAGATPQNENTIDALDELVKKEIPDVGGVMGPQPAKDIEFTALRKYIFEDGFVVATVAFHVVTLCAQPMVTPSTTTWDFVDRAAIPDMVFSLLKQPGYLEGIWPSLKIIMGSNKGNAAWCAGIATTIAFFDVVRTLPTLKDMNNEDEKKS